MFTDANVPGMPVSEMDTPALLIDLDIMEANIARMARFLEGKQAKLRPHYKSIKTPAIALKQLEAGAIGITCAKLDEAETLVNAGIKDILIANQVVGARKAAKLAGLARHADLMVAVDSASNVAELSEAAVAAGSRIRVLVEVNTGNNRCGVGPEEPAVRLAHKVADSPGLIFAGVMGYEGFAMHIMPYSAREDTVRKCMDRLLATKDAIEQSGLKVEIVSGAGTGTHAIAASITGITEIQAGTYVLMDTDYRNSGEEFGLALTMLSTVISRPEPDVAIADAGLKSLTTEHGTPEVVGVPGGKLTKMSEEHGKIELSDPTVKLDPGDKVRIYPSHLCTTMNLHDTVYGIRNGRVEVVWPIVGRGKVR